MNHLHPDQISNVLQPYFGNLQKYGTDLASMDHSPSEQLSDAEWHNTVMIMSPGGQHHEMARAIGEEIRPQHGKFRKWRGAKVKYRKRFAVSFSQQLKVHPVLCFAISAKSLVIHALENWFVDQLDLGQLYHKKSSEGSSRVHFGPLLRNDLQVPEVIKLFKNRAIMCMFITHFLRRIHTQMLIAGNMANSEGVKGIDLFFYADKFPGPPNADMDLMFQYLINSNHCSESIKWANFTKSDDVDADLLADNLSGLLNQQKNNPGFEIFKPIEPSPPPGGLFY